MVYTTFYSLIQTNTKKRQLYYYIVMKHITSLIKINIMRDKLIQFRVSQEEFNSIKENADELTIPTGTFSRISTLTAVKNK